MIPSAPQFTAAQIAATLGCTPQAVRDRLRGILPAGECLVSGNMAKAWRLDQIPAPMLEALKVEAVKQKCRDVETLLAMPSKQWAPALPLAKVLPSDIEKAGKLRDVLLPWLKNQHTPGEYKEHAGWEYARLYGNQISERHLTALFIRTIQRDGGREDFNNLALYLPDRLKAVESPVERVHLHERVRVLRDNLAIYADRHDPSKDTKDGAFKSALAAYCDLLQGGVTTKKAAAWVRQALWEVIPSLAASKAALWMTFSRRLEAMKAAGNIREVRDGRENNGDRVELPQVDIDLLRHAASARKSGRIDSAWRDVWEKLSPETRARLPYSITAPVSVHSILNRAIVDVLTARHHGKRTLRRSVGCVERDWENFPSMYSWVADDVTSNIEVIVTEPDGSIRKTADGVPCLILPQIVAVMDSASRKWVGWAISDDRAPTAELVCCAVLDGIRAQGVPKLLGLENGFVFGKSLNVNGKVDNQGRTLVAGLAQYGCTLHHFEKMNPRSKAELEKSFDLVQRLMEEHPGYAGRLQMVDAPEEFRREQRLIKSGKIEPTEHRYTFAEFLRVMAGLIEKYNSTPQQGHLKGLSPNEAFAALLDAGNPPVQFTPEIEWMLANERYQVTVGVGGVEFPHYGRKIRVRGGRLTQLLGKDLFALVDRRDDSMVTFMNLDFTEPFTLEVCSKVSPRESSITPGGDTLAKERGKLREHERAVSDEYNRLIGVHGNPRRELLRQLRGQTQAEDPGAPQRRVLVPGAMVESANQMEAQREEIRSDKSEKQKRQRRASRLMQETGIYMSDRAAAKVSSDETNDLNAFLKGGKSPQANESGKTIYYLKPFKDEKGKP